MTSCFTEIVFTVITDEAASHMRAILMKHKPNVDVKK